MKLEKKKCGDCYHFYDPYEMYNHCDNPHIKLWMEPKRKNSNACESFIQKDGEK